MNDYNKFNKVNKRKEEWQKWQLRASGDLGKTRMHYRHQRSHLITVWRYKHTIDWTFQNSGLFFFVTIFNYIFLCNEAEVALRGEYYEHCAQANERSLQASKERSVLIIATSLLDLETRLEGGGGSKKHEIITGTFNVSVVFFSKTYFNWTRVE